MLVLDGLLEDLFAAPHADSCVLAFGEGDAESTLDLLANEAGLLRFTCLHV